MPRGTPDYNVPEYTFFSIETPNSDIVAERQGFSRLDNRGRVLWFDDFREGIKRWAITSGSGGSDPSHVFTQGALLGFYGSAILKPNVLDGSVTMQKNMILPVSKKLGVEVGILQSNTQCLFTCYLGHAYNPSKTQLPYFQLDGGTGKIYINTTGGAVLVYTPPFASWFTGCFISLKMVYDFESGHYLRLMVGNTQIELSNYVASDWAGIVQGKTNVTLQAVGQANPSSNDVYVGYVIISGDEP